MSRVISAGVSEDLADRVEEHTEDGESRSKAIDRLLRAGLDAEESGRSITAPSLIIWLGSMFAAGAFLETSPTVGLGGLVVMGAGFIASTERWERARAAAMKRYNRSQDVAADLWGRGDG